MGLGLELSAPLPGGADRLLADVEAASRGIAEELGDPVSRWQWSSVSEGRLYLSLCPFEENVEFWIGDGRLHVSARTSGAGPGYHQLVVGLLDRLRADPGLAWEEDDERVDETGYFAARDEAALRTAMARQVRSVARVLIDRFDDSATSIQLGFPVGGDAPQREAFAISPLGEWPRAWFEELATADLEEAEARAREFLPWWEAAPGADDLRKLGLAWCWTEVGWVAPADERETAACETALACFDRARALDPEVAVPEWEIAELRRLLRGGEEAPPRESGIGFRRTEMLRPLTGGWTVRLPGYYHAQYEAEDSAQVYWFGGRSVRGASWSFDRRSSPTEVLDALSDTREAAELALPHEHLAARFSSEWDDDHEVHALSLYVARRDGLCLVTVTHADDEDADWALDVGRSVVAPSPREG